MEIDEESREMISKFAFDTVKKLEAEKVSKFSNEIDAYSLDASSTTVSQQFTQLVRLVKPVLTLEKMGVVRVQDVDPQTDIATFSVQAQQAFTWTAYDTRASEKTSLAAGSGSYQSYTAPAYVQITPLGYTSTLFIHENISLVNPVKMAEIMAQVTEEIVSAKEQAVYTALATTASYTASISIRECNGFTALGASGSLVVTGSILTPADLVKAKKFLKTNGNRKVIPDTVLLATEQLSDLENSADFSPGQSSNANFKKAVFDQNGTLVRFDGMQIIEAVGMPQITTGQFASSNGHYVYVGKKGLMAGLATHSSKDKVRTFTNPEDHGTKITIDVSYACSLLHPTAMMALAASDD